MSGREEVYSNKIRAGKRTYFFDVRPTRSEDYYITITESKRRFNDRGYEKHKIFLYKEDFNKFSKALMETIDHVKTELMPEYDYEEFDRQQAEYERQRALEAAANEAESQESTSEETVSETTETVSEEVETEVIAESSEGDDFTTSWDD